MRRGGLAEIDLQFLGRQLAAVLDSHREIKADIDALKSDLSDVKATLATTATRDLLLSALYGSQVSVDLAQPPLGLLREALVPTRRVRLGLMHRKLRADLKGGDDKWYG